MGEPLPLGLQLRLPLVCPALDDVGVAVGHAALLVELEQGGRRDLEPEVLLDLLHPLGEVVAVPVLEQLRTYELRSQVGVDLGLAPVGLRPVLERLGLVIAAEDPGDRSLVDADLLRDVVLRRERAALAVLAVAQEQNLPSFDHGHWPVEALGIGRLALVVTDCSIFLFFADVLGC